MASAAAKTISSLLQKLVDQGSLRSPAIINAMKTVDRANYAPFNPYEDSPQSIGHGQTISAPHMHAIALECLLPNLQKTHAKVLDVGSGSGYLAAVMARLNPTARVVGVDCIPEIVSDSIENVKRADDDLLQSGRLVLRVGDGWAGSPENAPFDCIHIGAAAPRIPEKTIVQLKVGGTMVVPIGPAGEAQKLVLIKRVSESGNISADFEGTTLMSVVYVPLVEH